MQKVFSNPPEPPKEREAPPASAAPPVIPPRESGYVREVTQNHENAIARILARVKAHEKAAPKE